VTPSSPLIFRATPAFTFTFPAGVLAGYAYVAFFDPVNPQLGWNTLLGPVQANGTSTTFASQLDDSPPLALGANTGYVFALVQNATALPTPPPAPYGITEYAVPNGVSAGLTNGMTKGPDGNIWFTENLNDNIDKITTSGVVTQYPLPASVYEGPQGIAAGPDGNLWFAEYANATIGKITPGGVITEYPLPTAGSGPVNIAAGPDGNLWFTEYLSNAIGKITPSGAVTEYPLPVTVGQASFNPGPFGITAGADGNLWFADSNFASTGGNSIGKITPSGVITNYPIPTSNALTIGIAVGPDGNVWFVENLAKQIGKITPAGVVTEYPVTYSAVSLQEIVAGADGKSVGERPGPEPHLPGHDERRQQLAPCADAERRTERHHSGAGRQHLVYGTGGGPDRQAPLTLGNPSSEMTPPDGLAAIPPAVSIRLYRAERPTHTRSARKCLEVHAHYS